MTRSFPVSQPVRSLTWEGDDLVDIAAGWHRWRSDGSEEHSRVSYAFAFDGALVSTSGRFQLLYTERGTKGLVLEDGKILREIDRSFYHANDYDYPAALGRLPDGREILVHCPDTYNVLEIEELATGRRLTMGARRPVDVFHSRLTISPNGRYLLSAGWLWHPVGTVEVYDLVAAVHDPTVLDQRSALWRQVDASVEAACWLDPDRLVVVGHPDEEPSTVTTPACWRRGSWVSGHSPSRHGPSGTGSTAYRPAPGATLPSRLAGTSRRSATAARRGQRYGQRNPLGGSPSDEPSRFVTP